MMRDKKTDLYVQYPKLEQYGYKGHIGNSEIMTHLHVVVIPQLFWEWENADDTQRWPPNWIVCFVFL